MVSEITRFTWVSFYKELANTLLQYENRQQELLKVLKDLDGQGLKVGGLLDKNEAGQLIPLSEIDPFTFFSTFNRGTKNSERIKVLENLKTIFSLDASVPSDFTGVPVVNAQNSWFFDYAYARTDQDVKHLWYLFKIVLSDDPFNHPEFNQYFDTCLSIKEVAARKLTIGLFWVRPDYFPTLDKKMQAYMDFPAKHLTGEHYKKWVESIPNTKPYYELSHEAHASQNKVKAGKPTPVETKDFSKNEVPESLMGVAKLIGIDTQRLSSWLGQLERKGQIILQGPPGTGKTFVAQHLAQWLAKEGGKVELVQFHPSYSYEDFIQGYRPDTQDGQLVFNLKSGVFKRFCDEARASDKPCVLIIDEINRANLSSVFGELMYLLEYRDNTVTLQSEEPFSIPKNVRIIGTMNTADRSIALMDHALRRRFAFIELAPQYDLVQRHLGNGTVNSDALVEVLAEINAAIDDPHYALGHSYFLNGHELEAVWDGEIYPYLTEYFIDQKDRIASFSWLKVKERLYATDAENV